MTTAHTPGPWFYDTGETKALIVEKDGTTVAEICTTYQTTAHRSLEANVRLMAAAPDLLAALQTVAAMAESFPEELHKNHPDVIAAHAAIARAKGINT